MAKNTQRREGKSVSLEEYESGRPWRETSTDLSGVLERDTDEITLEERVGSFTLRLLRDDKSGAADRFVQLVGLDSLSGEMESDGLVTVRPVTEEGETGRAESYQITSDGLIVTATDGTNSEEGYFVSGPGIGGDELGNCAMQELIPREKPELKAISLDLPFDNQY